jgi:hypothetical protein
MSSRRLVDLAVLAVVGGALVWVVAAGNGDPGAVGPLQSEPLAPNSPTATFGAPSGSMPTLESAVPPTTPPLGPCGKYVVDIVRHRDFYSVVGLSSYSEGVVVARIVTVGEGQWATKDGAPPISEVGLDDAAYNVYHNLVVEVEDIGKRSGRASSIVVGQQLYVRVLGGTIGCRTYALSDDLRYMAGDDVALFLGRQPTLNLLDLKTLDAIDVWPIKDGLVQGRSGPLVPADLLSQSEDATASPTSAN